MQLRTISFNLFPARVENKEGEKKEVEEREKKIRGGRRKRKVNKPTKSMGSSKDSLRVLIPTVL